MPELQTSEVERDFEAIQVERRLRKVLEDLYESSYHYPVEHALTAHLLERDREISDKIPDPPRNREEAIVTLFVSTNPEHLLHAIEVLEKHYIRKLYLVFSYLVIALDRLLDSGLIQPAKRLYEILTKTNLSDLYVPVEDRYIIYSVFQRAAQTLALKPVPLRSIDAEEEVDDRFKTIVDIAINQTAKELEYQKYQSVLDWISRQLKQNRYSEIYDEVETLPAEIPPPLFFSPARLYVVWKFLRRAVKLRVAPQKYVLDEECRRFLLKTLVKKRRYMSIKLSFMKGFEKFIFTLLSTSIMIIARFIFRLKILSWPLVIQLIVFAIVEFSIGRYMRDVLERIRVPLITFFKIKMKQEELKVEIEKLDRWIKKHSYK